MSEPTAAGTLLDKVAAHGERLQALETEQDDHSRRLDNHGKSIHTINMMGWAILGGVLTNILLTVWKR